MIDIILPLLNILLLVVMVLGGIVYNINSRLKYNNGIHRECGGNWIPFDRASNGETGYKCDLCSSVHWHKKHKKGGRNV